MGKKYIIAYRVIGLEKLEEARANTKLQGYLKAWIDECDRTVIWDAQIGWCFAAGHRIERGYQSIDDAIDAALEEMHKGKDDES